MILKGYNKENVFMGEVMTIEKELKLIELELKTLVEFNNLSQQLLKKVKVRDISISDKVIYMHYKKIIELTEGGLVISKANLGGIADILLRDIMETFAHLRFITEDNNLIKERAEGYYFQSLKIAIKEMEEQKNLYKKNEKALKEIKSIISDMSGEIKNSNLSRFNEKWKEKYYYFQMLTDITGVTQFVNYYKPIGISKSLYGFTSQQIHGLNNLRDFEILTEKKDISQLNYIRSDTKFYNIAFVYGLEALGIFAEYFQANEPEIYIEIKKVITTYYEHMDTLKNDGL